MLRGNRNKAFLLLKKSLDDAFRKSYAEDHQVLFDSPTYTRLKELLDARAEEMVKKTILANKTVNRKLKLFKKN